MTWLTNPFDPSAVTAIPFGSAGNETFATTEAFRVSTIVTDCPLVDLARSTLPVCDTTIGSSPFNHSKRSRGSGITPRAGGSTITAPTYRCRPLVLTSPAKVIAGDATTTSPDVTIGARSSVDSTVASTESAAVIGKPPPEAIVNDCPMAGDPLTTTRATRCTGNDPTSDCP